MQFTPKIPEQTADISIGKRSWKEQVETAVMVLLFLAAVWWLTGLLGTFVGARIPDSWERKLSGAGGLMSEGGETGTLDRAQVILDKLLEGESIRKLDYRLMVMDADGANAFAIPGGWIAVTTGLLSAVSSEEGLAFVLAHEVGHHQYRHMTRRLGRTLLQGLILGVMFGQQDAMGLTDSAVRLAEAGYSRDDEREADDFALRLVHRKYGSTDAALEFFRYVTTNEEEHLWQSFAGSHPPTKERIDDLMKLQQELMTPD